MRPRKRSGDQPSRRLSPPRRAPAAMTAASPSAGSRAARPGEGGAASLKRRAAPLAARPSPPRAGGRGARAGVGGGRIDEGGGRPDGRQAEPAEGGEEPLGQARQAGIGA